MNTNGKSTERHNNLRSNPVEHRFGNTNRLSSQVALHKGLPTVNPMNRTKIIMEIRVTVHKIGRKNRDSGWVELLDYTGKISLTHTYVCYFFP